MFQYKTERNGVVETRVEQKITIQSDGDPIDHDRALAEAIQVTLSVLSSPKTSTMAPSSNQFSQYLIVESSGNVDVKRYF